MAPSSPNQQVLRLLISTLKGGPGKTTTAILVAIGFARRGHRVLVIDADNRTRGALDWTEEAVRLEYQVPYVLAVWHDHDGPLSDFASRMERDHQADVVIIDTGGEQPETFVFGCLYADRLLCPVGPMRGELRRMVETYRHARAVDERSPLLMSALLTRVPQAGRGKAKIARDDLASTDASPDTPYSLGIHVMATEITRNVAYDEFHGIIPDDIGEYDDLVDELLAESEPENESSEVYA